MNLFYVFVLLVCFLYVFLSLTSDPRMHLHSPTSFHFSIHGKLPRVTINNRIKTQAEKWFRGQFEAPEHFTQDKKGNIYFSISDGRILVTRKNPQTPAFLLEPETVVFTGNPLRADRQFPCGSIESEQQCGRPLGMAVDAEGNLIVADAYLGLLKVNPVTKTKEILVDHVDGLPLYFTNSVVVGPKTGLIYFTDSTQRWRRRDFVYEVLESRPTGRLIVYNPQTKLSRVLVDELAFANGLLVDPINENYLILNELNRARLLRVDLQKLIHSKNTPTSGSAASSTTTTTTSNQQNHLVRWNEGKHWLPEVSILMDDFPGFPDNLAWEQGSHELFWVGCGTERKYPFSMLDLVSSLPTVRSFLAWSLPKSFHLRLVPKVGALFRMRVEMDGTQPLKVSIIDTLQDRSGEHHLLTGAYEFDGYLYIGSISEKINWLSRIEWNANNKTIPLDSGVKEGYTASKHYQQLLKQKEQEKLKAEQDKLQQQQRQQQRLQQQQAQSTQTQPSTTTQHPPKDDL